MYDYIVKVNVYYNNMVGFKRDIWLSYKNLRNVNVGM